jgi:hypothetical protein
MNIKHYTVKSAHAVISIKKSPVLKGHLFLLANLAKGNVSFCNQLASVVLSVNFLHFNLL